MIYDNVSIVPGRYSFLEIGHFPCFVDPAIVK